MTEFFTGITALAALLAAGAAWKSARASQRGSALAQKAALLGAIPILVPWVEAKSTTLKVLNRGASDAHETRWYLIQGETVKAEGPHPKIIPKGGASDLTDQQHGVLAGLLKAPEFSISLETLVMECLMKAPQARPGPAGHGGSGWKNGTEIRKRLKQPRPAANLELSAMTRDRTSPFLSSLAAEASGEPRAVSPHPEVTNHDNNPHCLRNQDVIKRGSEKP